MLRELLGEDRINCHWLAATVLTLGEPPKALVEALAGDLETLASAPEEIERRLGAKLFAACVHMMGISAETRPLRELLQATDLKINIQSEWGPDRRRSRPHEPSILCCKSDS